MDQKQDIVRQVCVLVKWPCEVDGIAQFLQYTNFFGKSEEVILCGKQEFGFNKFPTFHLGPNFHSVSTFTWRQLSIQRKFVL
jgi:hypothetical protein